MSFRACLCLELFVTVAALKTPRPDTNKLYVWSKEDRLVEYEPKDSLFPNVATVSFSMNKPLKYVTPGAVHFLSKSNLELETAVDEESMGKHGNTVIHKKLKLAMCYFPKVASAEINSMFNNMNGYSLERIEALGAHVFGFSSPENLGVKRSDMTKENGWKFGFFTRDPLSRFLSAFGSKCLPKEDGTPSDVRYCGGRIGQTEEDGWSIIHHPVQVEEAVRAFEQHAMHFKEALYTEEGKLTTNNRHYMRMVDILNRCGMSKFAPDKVDFIGHLTGPVHRQMKEFIYMGLPASAVATPLQQVSEATVAGDNAPTPADAAAVVAAAAGAAAVAEAVTEAVNTTEINLVTDSQMVNTTEIDFFLDKFFPEGSRHGHTSTHTPATFYRNWTIRTMVHEMYKADYDLLGQVYDGDRPYYRGPRP